MLKEEMIDYLNSTTIDDFPELYVPSYHRPRFVFGNIMRQFSDEALKKCHVVVREGEKEDYLKENKDLFDRGCDLLLIPEGAVNGLGSTRNLIIEDAINRGVEIACDFDDDITIVNALYEGKTAKGDEKSAYFKKADRDGIGLFSQKVFQGACRAAKRVIENDPKAIFGAFRRQQFSNSPDFNRHYAYINRGATPRQSKFYNVALMKEAGLRVPDAFDRHGEDVGFASRAILDGYDEFILISFIEDHVSELQDSVIRSTDEEKNRHLHKSDEDGLKEMGAYPFIKVTKTYEDGTPMYFDINWQKAHKLGYCDEARKLSW